MLKSSALKEMLCPSVIFAFFWKEMSHWWTPGPRNVFLPRFPHVLFAGTAYAAIFNQLSSVWFAG